jgi:hypothetical protein
MLADGEDKLVAAAISTPLIGPGAASGLKAALLSDSERREVTGVDFEQELAKPKIREGPVRRTARDATPWPRCPGKTE